MAEIPHQLSLVAQSHDLHGFGTIQTVVGNGISEPSTVPERWIEFFSGSIFEALS